MPLTPIALKTQLETVIAAEINKFAGVTGTNIDPDLAAGRRAKSVVGGYLLLSQDRKQGPLVRLKLMALVKQTDENGNGEDGRSVIYNGQLRIVGISGHSTSISTVASDRDMLDQVVLLDLLKALGDEMTIEAQNLTGGKAAYVAELNHVSTSYLEELAEGEQARTKDYIGIFSQEWECKIEQTAGF